MTITLTNIKVADLVAGYQDNADDGVVGYGGRLDIRPQYQREFVYKDKQRDAVIDTLQKGFPLNVMYWVRKGQDAEGQDLYEVLDGQQRTISICEYVTNGFSLNNLMFANLPSNKQQAILDYELTVYICEGAESEKLEWFKTINIAGEVLTEQELRNAVYAGPWLSDAKRYFSRSGRRADALSKDYTNVKTIRQELLELVLSWINGGKIEAYMDAHRRDVNANELWLYFQSVIAWVQTLFPTKHKEMKGVAWGELYNKYKDRPYDAKTLEAEVDRLMRDPDVTNKRGIYPYVLDPTKQNERYLSIRAFDDNQKSTAYAQQGGVCPCCKEKFDIEEMEGDHITPWREGGKTVIENLQMLCKECNRRKGSK